jgi:hypothetical protein
VDGLEVWLELELPLPPQPVKARNRTETVASQDFVLDFMCNPPETSFPNWAVVRCGTWPDGRRVHVLSPVRYITEVTCK